MFIRVRTHLLSLCAEYYTGWDRDGIPFGFNSETEKEEWAENTLDELDKLSECPSSRACFVMLKMLARNIPHHGRFQRCGDLPDYERLARFIVEVVCDAKRRLNKKKPMALSKSEIKMLISNLDVQELLPSHIAEIVHNTVFMSILFDRNFVHLHAIYEIFSRVSEQDRFVIFRQYEKELLSVMMSGHFSFLYSCVNSPICDFIFAHPMIIDRLARHLSESRFSTVSAGDEDYRRMNRHRIIVCQTACLLLRKSINEPSRLEEMLGHGLLLAAGHLSETVEGDEHFDLFSQILHLHPQMKPSFAELTEKGPLTNRLANLGRSLLFNDSPAADYVLIEHSDEE